MRRAIFFYLIFLAAVATAGFFILLSGEVSRAAGNQLAFTNCVNGSCSAGDWQQTVNDNGDYWIFNNPESVLATGMIDLSRCTTAAISFDYKRYYSSATGTSDMLYLESSVAGSEWRTLQSFQALTTAFISSTPVTLFCGSNLQLRFRGSVDVDSRHGVGVNNVRLDLTLPNQPPVAVATSTKTAAETGEEIEFSDGGSTDPDGNALIDWLWDFGQQLTRHGVNVSQSFPASGTYAVNYYVVDSEGATSSPAILNLFITDPVGTTTPTSTPTTTLALKPQIGDVVINEIYPAPDAGEEEWIELFNTATSTRDLSELLLLNIDGDKFVTTTLSGEISPGQYLAVENIAGNLNNDGDTIVLSLADKIFDQTVYGDYSNKKGEAWARNSSGIFEETITPTKGAINVITPKPVSGGSTGGGSSPSDYQPVSIETASSTTSTAVIAAGDYYGKLIINELFPHPATGANDEFIELKNISTTTIDLNGFYLTDNTNKKHYLRAASSTLPLLPQELIAIKRASTSIALNDTGFETANLFSPLGELLDRVSYTAKQSEGLAYARTAKGEWLWTEQPTPGAENIFPGDGLDREQTVEVLNTIKAAAIKKAAGSSGAIHAVSMEELKNLAVGDKVRVSGVVSVEPGVLGTQIFYLAGSGIQVYCNKKDFPELKVGDRIEVVGEISETAGERRIKIKTRDDIKYLSSEAEPQPQEISAIELEDNIGSLVKISGELLEIKGRNAFVDDGSGEVKVYLKNRIDTKEINWHAGDKVTVVGIASLTASGARLLPRSAKDITAISGQVKGAYEVGDKAPFLGSPLSYAVAVIIFFIAFSGWLGYKLRAKNSQ
ncbi:MAG: lamin tail domain-containing protein [Candidatus Buchananbacteria bacterium]